MALRKQERINHVGKLDKSKMSIKHQNDDDLDLFYVYFSSIMSCEYPIIEKNCPKLTKKNLCLVCMVCLAS